MTRTEFAKFAEKKFEEILELFRQKNKSYGQDEDAFFNFNSSALRVFGENSYQSQFKVLTTYMDKHLVALANRGIDEPEFEGRLKDVIVYALLAIGMGEEAHDKNGGDND